MKAAGTAFRRTDKTVPYQTITLRDQTQPRLPRVPPADACADCPTVCAEACFNDAITRTGVSISIDAARCAGCGGCIGACRHARIVLARGIARLRP
jgi:Fe-S-cluster-containing hydrogenase component 2